MFLGRTISQLGTSISSFTIPWLILEQTGSAAQTAIAFAVGFVPYLMISMPAGVWADHMNRKKLMLLADIARMLLLILLPLIYWWTGVISLVLLYVVQAGISLFSALFDAAYGASLPNLIDRTQLPEGNAALQLGFSFSRIAGPVVAGILIAWFGTANTIWIDACSYLFSILTLLWIRTSFSTVHRNSLTQTTMIRDIKEGLTYVWNVRILRLLALFTMCVNLVGPGMDIALLYRLRQELELESSWSGWVMAGLSVGMVLGTLVIGWMKKSKGLQQLWMISSVGLVIPPFLLAWIQNPWGFFSIQIFIGLLLVVWNIQSTTIRQTMVPDHLIGRCVSLFRMIAWISIPLGAMIAGFVTEHWGSTAYFFVAGAVLAVVCVCVISKKGLTWEIIVTPKQKSL